MGKFPWEEIGLLLRAYRPKFRMPAPRPKQKELAKKWLLTVGTWSVATSLLTLYMTEWKPVLQYLPYYGDKYKEN